MLGRSRFIDRWSAIASQLPGRTYNEGDDIFGSFLTSEDYSSSSICTAKSKGSEVDFRAECYEMGSPGMVGGLQCFGEQLGSIEEFEIGNNHLHLFYDSIYQDSSDPVVGSRCV
ncbi:hypothetical protein L1987_58579 [Smallanthus sonchifolius]|uniref:Uncharacterized protein n=1 Tax=Smallanthus sonchifolius TaxID=185202 RepID=A0ACB9DG99_9ASTR|nr:hypothetical protein L1987_58579 [Smallanthus sonchifolius]